MIAAVILNLGAGWRWAGSSIPWPCYSWRKPLCCLLNKKFGEFQRWVLEVVWMLWWRESSVASAENHIAIPWWTRSCRYCLSHVLSCTQHAEIVVITEGNEIEVW